MDSSLPPLAGGLSSATVPLTFFGSAFSFRKRHTQYLTQLFVMLLLLLLFFIQMFQLALFSDKTTGVDLRHSQASVLFSSSVLKPFNTRPS